MQWNICVIVVNGILFMCAEPRGKNKPLYGDASLIGEGCLLAASYLAVKTSPMMEAYALHHQRERCLCRKATTTLSLGG